MDEIRIPPVIEHPLESVAFIAGQHPQHVTQDGCPDHWDHSGAGDGVTVGVVDTGADASHPELAGRIKAAKDFTGEGPGDSNSHGTHTASTIGGKTVGCAPNVDLVIAKVLGRSGSGSMQAVADGIRWCVDQECHLINASLGSPSGHPVLQSACDYATAAGVVIVAATGNEFRSRVSFPAGYNQSCVATGAVTFQLQHANFSNQGPSIDAVHYGVEIVAAVPGGGYGALSGTSMATPNLTARLALRLASEMKHLGDQKTTTVVDLKAFADCCFDDLGPQGRDVTYGWGIPVLEKFLYHGLKQANGGLPTDGQTYFAGVVGGRPGKFVFVGD